MAAANYSPGFNCSGPTYEDPKVWSFFEPPNGNPFYLDDIKSMVMRTAEDMTHQCTFYYIGRRVLGLKPNQPPKHSVVKFSVYEGTKILQWLEPILDMLDQYQPNDILIPYFGEGQQAEERAYQVIDYENRSKFWESGIDLELGSVKVKLVRKKISGLYDLHLLNPVKLEIQEKHQGWPGPSCVIKEPSFRRFRRFMKTEMGVFDETDAAGEGTKNG